MKKEEVDIVTEIDERFLQILRILMSGKTLKTNGQIKVEIGLAKTVNSSIQFFQLWNDRVLGDINIELVYRLSKYISDEDITIALAEITLQKINNKKR